MRSSTVASGESYALNNNNSAAQALHAGGTLTDTFTVTTVDGTAQLVTVTINGTNDAAVDEARLVADERDHRGRNSNGRHLRNS